MDFGYDDAFGTQPPDPYQRLLLDAASGDPTLFPRGDEVEAAWAFVAPIIDGCEKAEAELATYPAGSWGPKQADDLIAADGRRWYLTHRRSPQKAAKQ
jgi:glucose-6-phosphate 1-dehydrogenase